MNIPPPPSRRSCRDALVAAVVRLWSNLRLQRRRQSRLAPRIVTFVNVGRAERLALIDYADERMLLGITAGSISVLSRGPLPTVDETGDGGGDIAPLVPPPVAGQGQ